MADIRYPTHDAGATHPRVPVPPHYREFGYITSSMADAIARELGARGYEVEQRCVSNPSAAPRRYAVYCRLPQAQWQRMECVRDYERIRESL